MRESYAEPELQSPPPLIANWYTPRLVRPGPPLPPERGSGKLLPPLHPSSLDDVLGVVVTENVLAEVGCELAREWVACTKVLQRQSLQATFQ